MQLKTGDDSGFTLIELLVAVAILGVITIAVGDVIVGVLRNTQPTADRLALSHDAQISTAYFAQDVASLGVHDYSSTQPGHGNVPYLKSVDLNAAYNADGRICGSTPVETSSPALVRFFADGYDSSSPPAQITDIVAYYLVPVGAVDELHRMKCVGSSATPVSDVVVAHNVDPANPPVVTCSSQCDSASTPPQTVTLKFSVIKSTVGSYAITLSGQRRQT